MPIAPTAESRTPEAHHSDSNGLTPMIAAYVALGSNLGDRREHLQQAVDGLAADPRITVTAVSPVYENPAQTLDRDKQPDYLNAVVAVETRLSAEGLLALCLDLERAAGRIRPSGKRWEARTLDADVLLFGDANISSPTLTLPHPRMQARLFVLRPLADVAPNLYLPLPYEMTVSTMLARCPDHHQLVRIEPGLAWRNDTLV